VDDYYAGDVYAAFEEANNYVGGALFLFYAPWDVDSVVARDTLESVSRAFEDHTHMYFAAVNCWTNVGKCYKDFGAGKGEAKGGTSLYQVRLLEDLQQIIRMIILKCKGI